MSVVSQNVSQGNELSMVELGQVKVNELSMVELGQVKVKCGVVFVFKFVENGFESVFWDV